MVVLSAWPAEVLMPHTVQSPKSGQSPKSAPSPKSEPVTPRQRQQAFYASSFRGAVNGAMTADHMNPSDPARQLQVSADNTKACAFDSPKTWFDMGETHFQGSGR
ncbi:unnamed protein product [Effrenium voratum]|uniref:Uncharacterized protein n=1 Tax=Effrenium voratum TaxID=2562239 RepID=A0AA36MHD6_9DINO|nr:unnamed protein product [Effrenium voratum]